MVSAAEGTATLVLSVVSAEGAARPAALLPVVEAWLTEAGAVLATRCRTHLYATADVEACPGTAEALSGALRDRLRAEWRQEFGCDVNLARKGGDGRLLLVFDLDSTLIQMECIDEMARLAGVYDQVAVGSKCAVSWYCYNGDCGARTRVSPGRCRGSLMRRCGAIWTLPSPFDRDWPF